MDGSRAGLGAFDSHGRARRAGFDGVGGPGLDQDPVESSLSVYPWRPVFCAMRVGACPQVS